MVFKERNPKDAMAAIGKGLTPAERAVLSAPASIPKYPPQYIPPDAKLLTSVPAAPKTRPKWMSEAVVDPAWLKERPDVAAKAVQEPFALLGNEQVHQLDLLFDKKLFHPNNNNNDKRSEGALDLLGAVTDLLEDIVEIAEADPTVLTTAMGLEKAIAPNLLAFLQKVRGLVVDALGRADDELNRYDFVRGIWDHYIVSSSSESDIGPEEMLDAVVENSDTITLGRILDGLRERIAP